MTSEVRRWLTYGARLVDTNDSSTARRRHAASSPSLLGPQSRIMVYLVSSPKVTKVMQNGLTCGASFDRIRKTATHAAVPTEGDHQSHGEAENTLDRGHVRDYHRYVVGCAGSVGKFHQPLCARKRFGARQQHLGDALVGDDVRQPVAAEHEAVPHPW